MFKICIQLQAVCSPGVCGMIVSYLGYRERSINLPLPLAYSTSLIITPIAHIIVIGVTYIVIGVTLVSLVLLTHIPSSLI